nr:thioesterase family protein [uncultured Corynebacterium sp.]
MTKVVRYNASKEKNVTEGPIHTTTIPVRWSDFDRYGHLNNNSYIEIAQEARVKFAQDEFVARGYDMPTVFVRRVTADFLRPIMPDTQEAEVRTQVVRVGNTSFDTRQEVVDHNGNVCAVVEVVNISVDVKTSRPKSITANELKILTK